MVGVGLLALVWPDPTVRRLAILVGVALIVTGALEVAGAVRGVGSERFLLAVGGLTSIGFGLAAVAWPTVTTLVLSVVVGARLIVAAAGLVATTVGGAQLNDIAEPQAVPVIERIARQCSRRRRRCSRSFLKPSY